MKYFLLFLFSAIVFKKSTAQTTVSTNGNKYVLVEDVVSVSVPFTPDADDSIRKIRATNPNAICVTHHFNYLGPGSDSMALVADTPYINAYIAGVGGYPFGTVDRTVNSNASANIGIDRSKFTTALAQRLTAPSNFDISMSHVYIPSTDTLVVVLTGKALASLTGDYSFNVYVVEDSVSGTGTHYNQRNGYNSVPSSPFYGKGDPIVGYKHNCVLRSMLGGVWGTLAMSNPGINASTTMTFQYKIPASINMANMSIVGIVEKLNATNSGDREVQNAIRARVVICPEPENVQICSVSGDTTEHNFQIFYNVIKWNKAVAPKASAFKIYKEIGLNNYKLFGTQPANLSGSYTDSSMYYPGSAPRYKITVVDSCGLEKSLDSCTAHKQMFLSAMFAGNSSVNLQLSRYEGVSYSDSLVLWRKDGTQPFMPIATLSDSANSYYDQNVPNIFQVFYQVTFKDTNTCGPDTVGSNIAWVFVNVSKLDRDIQIAVYPDPVHDQFSIKGCELNDKVVLLDMTGKKIDQWSVSDKADKFNTTGIATGFYFVKLYDKNQQLKGTAKLYKN